MAADPILSRWRSLFLRPLSISRRLHISSSALSFHRTTTVRASTASSFPARSETSRPIHEGPDVAAARRGRRAAHQEEGPRLHVRLRRHQVGVNLRRLRQVAHGHAADRRVDHSSYGEGVHHHQHRDGEGDEEKSRRGQAARDDVVGRGGPVVALVLVLVRRHHRRRTQQNGQHAQPVRAPAPARRAGAQRPLPARRRQRSGSRRRRQAAERRRGPAAPAGGERGRRRRVRSRGGERGGGEGVGGPAGGLPAVHAADDSGEGDRGRGGAPGAAAPVPVPELAAPPPPDPPRLRRDLGGGVRRVRAHAGLPRRAAQEEEAPGGGDDARRLTSICCSIVSIRRPLLFHPSDD
ncbi:hypothetical protein PAHAL_9G405000 [Panicum hallii]|uniref:Uncharacterized protein n=1 Tax=Panicum hallii TaxID=206008 RepID=A0A2T8I485_9POAL|nr:hypothetical protein PAHAL_9G405000 [Panicum hallii]